MGILARLFGTQTSRPLSELRQILSASRSPEERLQALLEVRSYLSGGSCEEAAEEVFQTIMNDFSGEVVIAAAYACANPPRRYASEFRRLTMNCFKSAGDRSTSDGAPLLRLAYIATFEKDVGTLKKMVDLRDGANGVARIEKLIHATESGDQSFVYRLMAWSEGLDNKYRPEILQPLSSCMNSTELVKNLEEAVQYVKRNGSYE